MSFVQISPLVTEGNDAHVHHLLIYLCDGLNQTHVGVGDVCDYVANEVKQCLGGGVITAWAVGGEVRAKPLLDTSYLALF